MKKLLFTLLLATQFMFANNLNITNVTKVSDNSLSFDVSWDNSWWVSTYRDASWVFIKYKNSSGQWQHLDLTSATASGFTLYTYPDNKGVMISRATSGTGTVTGTLTVDFNGAILGPLPDFKVFGVEMVYINQGAFYVGDGASIGRFYQGNNNTLPYHVINSGEITVGNTANDINNSFLSQNIPATYPNGFDAFYMMKYEITNEQYAEFLNTLTFNQQQTRTETDLTNISSSNRFVMKNGSLPGIGRSSIACNANTLGTTPINFYCDANNNEMPNETADGQNIAASYLSANDGLAYLDWSALRPITDLEFEKASRGAEVYPINGGEYANGTNIATPNGNITNSNTANESVVNVGNDGLMNYNGSPSYPIRVGAFATATSTRLQSGASFYGVLELSGNLGESAVTTKDGNNLTFTSAKGDGILDLNGLNNEWNFITLYYNKGGSSIGSLAHLKISNRQYATGITQIDSRNNKANFRGAR